MATTRTLDVDSNGRPLTGWQECRVLFAIIEALGALAHRTRLGIFRLLVEQGPEGLPAGEIASRRQLANANASFHLKELANAGLVKAIPAGRFVYYVANYKTMTVWSTI